ncbi:protein kinase [Actinoplanes sp. TRM 88003]|uniref:non-specific serine/threonine protein kinase n=1 Tax=Paractinoplanes aksuensis TaxID=2939490 RepID=A0ABT1DMW3_9ACTN|nr:serine/threonine-protein kinase [Actinoplanes aksuensis]MCO8272144.1 protein kinase [Actinoplanes aksuensis]
MEVRQALGGRYTLLSELGRGGMAVVWRARDEVLGRPVAVKVLAGRYAGDPQSRARIRDEARSAATLSHPNIAQVYDYGEAENLPYVVMELVNGPTLQQRVSSGPLPPRTIFRICGEVAAALAAAHEDGLVHRDIKMANIMVPPAGVKVVDFGIAAAVGPASPEDRLVGTPAYLAPERLTGDAVEPASDIYALGVLLYRLLAHESPWSVESTTQMLQAHVYVDPAPLPQLPGVPAAVAEMIDRCLRKDLAERPTATEVAAVLGDAAEAASVPAPRPSPPAEAPRYLAQPTVVARPNDRPAVAGAPATRGNLGESSRFDHPPNSVWPATALDRPARRRPEAATGSASLRNRKQLLVGGGVVAVAAAMLVTWLVIAQPDPKGQQRNAGVPAPVVPPVATSAAARPSAGAAAGTVGPAPTAAGPPGRGVIVGSGAVPSVAPSAAASGPPRTSEPVAPSASGEPSSSSPPVVAPPAGKRLESPGGAVWATCEQGKATLTGAEPGEGFTAQTIEAGPAFTARILFTGAKAKYRMAVTCVGETPTLVVLPL